jgi:hypothetical protein
LSDGCREAASGAPAAQHKAVGALASRVGQPVDITALSDTFRLLGLALITALIATPMLKKPESAAHPAGRN